MLRVRNKKRIRAIFYTALFLFGCILSKLAYEQIIHHESILDKAKDLWQRDFKLAGQRGSIISKDGMELAIDIPSTSIIIVPSLIEDAEATSKILAEILNTDQEKLLTKITKHVSTQKLQPEGRNISDEQANAITEARLAGVVLVQDSKRYYPNNEYLSQVLGFTGIDNQGLAGLELQFDELLSAKAGDLKIPFDAKGNRLEVSEEVISHGSGMDVVLTIDSTIQTIIEREMNALMLRYKPKSALALAMNPKTGEILAMVSKPDFDPNHYQESSMEIINRNLPIWMSFEPGSTFKSVTFASALEEKCFNMYTDTYFDRGYEMVGGARIKSWKAGGHGLQTFLEVLENSSNPGFVEIGRRLGLDNLYQYVRDFGFGSKTGIELPGESSGIMFKKEQMGPVEQATVAFGQGLSVTPIQLVRAFSAIVNGGTLYQPYIVDSVLDPISGEVISQSLPTPQGQIISEETSALMRVALESVVANGGGKNAYIKGYQIGGKTGTAQKAVNGVYLSNEYILSFLSAAPINDPQIVIYVAADSPQNDVQYGGTVVAPVVRKCYEDILPYLNIEKVEEQIPKKKAWLDPIDVIVPNFIGKSKSECKMEGITFEFVNEGEIVIDQLPKPGSVFQNQGKVMITLG